MIHANITKKELTTTGEKPLATNLRNLLTRSQMEEIRQLSDELEVTHSYISGKLFGLPFDHLSQDGADDVITILKEMKSLPHLILHKK